MKKTSKEMWFDSFVIENEYLWAFANDINALIQYNMKTDETTILGSVPGEPLSEYALFWNIIKIDQELILIPARAKSLVVYNIDTGVFVSYALENPDEQYYSAARYKDKVFFAGCNNARIAVFSLKEKKITYIDDCEKYLLKKEKIKNPVVFRRNNTIIEGCLFYLPFGTYNAIAEVDMSSDSVKIFEMSDKYNGLRSICHNHRDGSFWITNWHGNYLIKWRPDAGVLDEIINPFCDEEGYSTADIYYYDGVLMYPTNEKTVIRYDDKKHEWFEVKELLDYAQGENKHPWKQNFPSSILENNVFYIFCGRGLSLLKMQLDNTIEWNKKIELDMLKVNQRIMREHSILFENNSMGVGDFIRSL